MLVCACNATYTHSTQRVWVVAAFVPQRAQGECNVVCPTATSDLWSNTPTIVCLYDRCDTISVLKRETLSLFGRTSSGLGSNICAILIGRSYKKTWLLDTC